MKALLFVILLCVSLVAQAQQPITNQDVINLVKSGLSDEVITAKIKQTGGNFDTSPAALKHLKDSGVPEPAIVAMIEASAEKPQGRKDPNQQTALLKDGTRVEIELASTVSSADLKEGDIVKFLTVHPVQVGGVSMIERGASATARVVKAEGGKSWGRGGQLTWAIQDVMAADGQKIPLHYSDATKGKGSQGSMTTGLVITGLLFWPAAPLWGFKKGKPAVIPAGKRFEVFVHGDAEINLAEASRRAASPNQSPTSTQQAKPEKTCVFGGQAVACK